jgi:hypothetical protein
MIKKTWMASDTLDVMKFDFLIISFVTMQLNIDV